MRIQRGYLPKLAGRPKGKIDAVPVPDTLRVALRSGSLIFDPAVESGSRVAFGDPLAWARVMGTRIALPAPAAGTVTTVPGARAAESDDQRYLLLDVTDAAVSPALPPLTPDRTTPEMARQAMARAGVWPLVTSCLTGGIPALDGSETPVAIIVNSVLAEPFRARGNVVVEHQWDHVLKGIAFLPRFLSDYGSIDIVLTAEGDPLAQRMRRELSGHAWTHVHSVPLRYPVEHPAVLRRALQRERTALAAADPVWVIDVQGVAAIGAALADGVPVHARTLALGGPGCPGPRHVHARIGTPLADLVPTPTGPFPPVVLRGGIINGWPIEEGAAVSPGDDSLFFLPQQADREFLSFLRPGMDRTSSMPCFAAQLLGRPDRHITFSLRGERRACIACSQCEKVCPMDLMPQLLHRYLYRDDLDEAAAAGLDRCIECRLCTFVCPSKIELREQFVAAKRQLEAERAEAEADAEATQNPREAGA